MNKFEKFEGFVFCCCAIFVSIYHFYTFATIKNSVGGLLYSGLYVRESVRVTAYREYCEHHILKIDGKNFAQFR